METATAYRAWMGALVLGPSSSAWIVVLEPLVGIVV